MSRINFDKAKKFTLANPIHEGEDVAIIIDVYHKTNLYRAKEVDGKVYIMYNYSGLLYSDGHGTYEDWNNIIVKNNVPLEELLREKIANYGIVISALGVGDEIVIQGRSLKVLAKKVEDTERNHLGAPIGEEITTTDVDDRLSQEEINKLYSDIVIAMDDPGFMKVFTVGFFQGGELKGVGTAVANTVEEGKQQAWDEFNYPSNNKGSIEDYTLQIEADCDVTK